MNLVFFTVRKVVLHFVSAMSFFQSVHKGDGFNYDNDVGNGDNNTADAGDNDIDYYDDYLIIMMMTTKTIGLIFHSRTFSLWRWRPPGRVRSLTMECLTISSRVKTIIIIAISRRVDIMTTSSSVDD